MEDKSIFNKVGESVTSFFTRKKVEQVAPPQVGACRRQPYGAFQFSIQAAPGATCEIYASTNLSNWVLIDTQTFGAGACDYVDASAPKFSYRFYRVIAAQIPSDFIVGYASVTTPPGYSMVANPFKTDDQRVSTLLADLPEGTTFNKFDPLKVRLTDNAIKNGRWTNPNETFVPGEGAILLNPTEDFRVVSFVGRVTEGKMLNPIPAGFSIRASMIPKAGRLDMDLNFPISEGDVVHVFDRDKQKYDIIPFDKKKWLRDAPLIGVGESFWVGKATAGNWVQDFKVR